MSSIMSVCLSVRPSTRMEQLGSHKMNFREIWYFSIFLISVENVQIWLKFDMNNGYFTRRPKYIYDNTSLSNFKNEKYFWQKLQRKSKHTFYVQWLFFSESHTIYEIMCKNVLQPDRPQLTTYSKVPVRWITNVTHTNTHMHTHSKYVILIAFPLQQWLHESASMLRLYVHWLFCL
jgi:hypothetical protein